MIEKRMDEADRRRAGLRAPNFYAGGRKGGWGYEAVTLHAPADEPWALDEWALFGDDGNGPIYEETPTGIVMTKERYEELMGIKVQTSKPIPPPKG
jgi:hypothetical protein